MTNPNLTHIQAIIDRSGSMQAIRQDAQTGFNSLIADQRNTPGDCLVSLVQFDHVYEAVYQDCPIDQTPDLELIPRGSTALLDAIGRTINDLGARLATLPEHERPGAILVCIVTDGHENASQEFELHTIKEMITHQEQVYSWTFIYVGTNQDAIEEGTKLGIRADHSLTFANDNSEQAYQGVSASIERYRVAWMSGQDVEQARKAGGFSDSERQSAG